MTTVYVLIGGCGSGKSTWAKEFSAKLNTNLSELNVVDIINMDSIRKEICGTETDQTQNNKVYSIAMSRFKNSVRTMVPNVILDNTNITKKNRKDALDFCKEYGCRVIAVFFTTAFDEAVKRNQSRERVVPVEVIKRMFSQLQPPTLDEGFEEIITI